MSTRGTLVSCCTLVRPRGSRAQQKRTTHLLQLVHRNEAGIRGVHGLLDAGVRGAASLRRWSVQAGATMR
eukprot:COSAG02_NODE_5445_length_4316_cov_1.519089_2_plen_70_part_00